jgi:hypothetical protein
LKVVGDAHNMAAAPDLQASNCYKVQLPGGIESVTVLEGFVTFRVNVWPAM